jgi:protease-4
MTARRGVFVFLVLLGLLGLAVLNAALQLRHPAPTSSSATVLTYDVPSQLEESEPPFEAFSLRGLGRESATLYDVVTALRDAAADEHVSALVLHIGEVRWGWAKLGEVRDAVQAFSRAGKPVYASLAPGSSEPEYLLASAADMIIMSPTGVLALNGLSLTSLYMKGTFEKLGVSPNYDHVGIYKSAIEGYTRTGASVPARVALEAVLDDHYRLLVDSLASGRALSRAAVARALDDGPYSGPDARRRGLLDTLLYDADVDSLALGRAGKHAETLPLTRYVERLPEARGGKHIALIVVEGTIVPGKGHGGGAYGRQAGAETLVESLREARRRHAIKAVVLRVDSPGGSAQASDDIWREVERCRQAKPVIVSMSDYAASGGYYVAVPADSIIADPATITGSIGIFGGKFNISGLLHKAGLSIETLSRGAHAGMYSPFTDFTPEEARRYHALLEDGYRSFIARVARGRHRTTSQVEAVAGGRVWTGFGARARGLVDALGGLEMAIDIARERAGIGPDEDFVVERLPKVKRSFLYGMIDALLSEDALSSRAALELPPALRALMATASLPVGEAMALMPYTIEVR